ncbi:efflux RND transporter periplasmic adaptor subunit [Parvularcula lutaonensis]|uniref:Efflux RND transporter periplasmic adaptor subunit n=1 Tax=Parvularcula lutaonensis TaxID=491923 RepID=A0ABV7MC07_9PROT|nr:efflux RND transporter periplasmic adaptor subunit [Parvularcula lutaonensis]GGY37776.1 secretion protein HlyD [Parvularcula lutaonensis]
MTEPTRKSVAPGIVGTGAAVKTAQVPLPEREDTPARRARRWPWLIGLVVILAGAGVAFMRSGGGGPAVPVEVLVPALAERVLIVSGRTESALTADLTSPVAGTVLAVLAEEGQKVAQSAELVRFDDGRPRAALRQAVAALDAAILRRQQAEDDARRAEELGAVLPKVERDRAEKALAQARAEEERLAATVEQARLALADYSIRAPFAGTVLSRAVDPGETVQPGRLLLRLADLGKLRVSVEVDEALAAAVSPGQRAVVELAGRDAPLRGRVAWVAPEADAVTGTVPVRIAFETMPEDAQVGLTAVVNITVAQSAAALTVPRSALVEGPAVFVLRDGRAVKTPVKIIDWPAERVEITGGLAAGDMVILNPEGLADGQEVRTAPMPGGAG